MPSQAHSFLKARAKKWLLMSGFSVKYEYRVELKGKKMFVDVVGFKGDKSIAIECGRTPPEKIEVLKEFFTEVILFPYTNAVFPGKFRQENIPSTPLYKGGTVRVPWKVITALGLIPGESTVVWVQEGDRIILESAFQE